MRTTKASSLVYHALNSYDEGDRIVLEVVRHPKVFVNGGGPFGDPPTLERWTIDLTMGRVREERLDDRIQEFPRVDERLVGRRHRFGYTIGAGLDPDGLVAADVLLKHDADKQSAQAASFGAGREPSEFVFVPSSADAAEDDGVVMGWLRSADELSDGFVNSCSGLGANPRENPRLRSVATLGSSGLGLLGCCALSY